MLQWLFSLAMERVGRLIGKLKLPKGAVSSDELACAAWNAVVGKRIASHAKAVALVDSCLVVEVEDAIWRQQLYTLRGQILSRIGEMLDQHVVTQIKFRLAIPRHLPQRAEAAKLLNDEADGIEDPGLRRIYRTSRKKAIS